MSEDTFWGLAALAICVLLGVAFVKAKTSDTWSEWLHALSPRLYALRRMVDDADAHRTDEERAMAAKLSKAYQSDWMIIASSGRIRPSPSAEGHDAE